MSIDLPEIPSVAHGGFGQGLVIKYIITHLQTISIILADAHGYHQRRP
jgi:hypothetical protein